MCNPAPSFYLRIAQNVAGKIFFEVWNYATHRISSLNFQCDLKESLINSITDAHMAQNINQFHHRPISLSAA